MEGEEKHVRVRILTNGPYCNDECPYISNIPREESWLSDTRVCALFKDGQERDYNRKENNLRRLPACKASETTIRKSRSPVGR